MAKYFADKKLRTPWSFMRYHWQLYAIAAVLVTVLGGLSAIAIRTNNQDKNTGSFTVQPVRRPVLPENRTYTNNLEKRVLTELDNFGTWLKQNNSKGYIGEFGWPYTTDAENWNTLATSWFKELDHFDIWTTAWAAGSWWGGYPMAIYSHASGERDLDTANAQSTVMEKFLSSAYGDRRGVNVAGMEFGADNGLRAASPGTVGTDYFYEPASSYAYLAQRGIKTVRLPFRWERIQPVLNGPLKDNEIQAIRSQLDAAQANGIQVILDLHNYGGYEDKKLGDGKLNHDHLTNVWLKLSEAFKSHPALLGYGLMNEPVDMPKSSYQSSAKNWEAASQKVVTALRLTNDANLILVAGYDWSSLARWSQNHPMGWITDHANNFRYEAHHYWDQDGSGKYEKSFAQELKESE